MKWRQAGKKPRQGFSSTDRLVTAIPACALNASALPRYHIHCYTVYFCGNEYEGSRVILSLPGHSIYTAGHV